MLEFLVSESKRIESIDLSQDRLALQRLREAVEKAKIELSSATQTEINLPFITVDSSGAEQVLDDEKPPVEDEKLDLPDTALQVSEVTTSLEFQINHDSITSDPISVNEINDLKDDIAADCCWFSAEVQLANGMRLLLKHCEVGRLPESVMVMLNLAVEVPVEQTINEKFLDLL
ncbi:hypothetical protein Droror1_Dr00017657 [Drosera rotundifolia]